MFLIFVAALLLIIVCSSGIHYSIRLNGLNAGRVTQIPEAGRRTYQPMLRLLSEEDVELASASPELARNLRATRRRIFRSYLRCLSKDYSRLMGGVRWIMVNSSVDRPDLANLLSRQSRMFAFAMCRIEWTLALHAVGIRSVAFDASGLVAAIENLTGIVNVFSPAQA